MKYNLEKYKSELSRVEYRELIGWIMILISVGIFSWLVFELIMYFIDRPSLFN